MSTFRDADGTCRKTHRCRRVPSTGSRAGGRRRDRLRSCRQHPRAAGMAAVHAARSAARLVSASSSTVLHAHVRNADRAAEPSCIAASRVRARARRMVRPRTGDPTLRPSQLAPVRDPRSRLTYRLSTALIASHSSGLTKATTASRPTPASWKAAATRPAG